MNKIILLISLSFLISCSKKVEITGTPKNIGPQTIKLNGPLVSGGNVSEKFEVSSSERKVVYIAEESLSGVKDLYTVNLDGTVRKNLTNLPLGKNVKEFKLSGDGKKIVFLADITTSGRDDLYTIDLDGNNLHQVNDGLNNNNKKIKSYRFFHSSYKVIYISDELILGSNDLYVANYNGTSRQTINQKTGITDFFTLKADDSLAVFGIKQSAGVKSEVLSAKIDNSSHYDVSKITLAGTREVLVYTKSSSKNSNIIFGINDEGGSVIRIFKNDWEGVGTPQRISLASGSDTLPSVRGDLVFSSNGKFVAYEKFELNDGVNNKQKRLYVSSTDITQTSQITTLSSKNSYIVKKMVFSEDSTRLIYSDMSNDLYSSSIDGSSVSKVNMNQVDSSFFEKNGRIYFLEENGLGLYNLMSVNLSGSEKRQENPTISTGVGFKPFSSGIKSFAVGIFGLFYAGSDNSYLPELFFKNTKLPILGEISSSLSSDRESLVPFEDRVIYRVFDGTSNNLYITRITE